MPNVGRKNMKQQKSKFPKSTHFIGAGIEFPHEFDDPTLMSYALDQSQLVEIIPEGFFYGKRAKLLKELGRRSLPVVIHSVEMSLGSDEPLPKKHIDQILDVASQVNCVAISDHVCMTRSGGVDIGQLTTIAYTQESLDALCHKIDGLDQLVRRKIGAVPIALENITHRFQVPHNTLSEPEFLSKMVQRTGVGLLLDVTNLYINSVNFKFDPYTYLDQLAENNSLSHLIQGIHLAGGEWEDSKLYDTHSRETHPEVWDLFRSVMTQANPAFVIVEWDQSPPSVDALYHEVKKALAIRHEIFSTTHDPIPNNKQPVHFVDSEVSAL